MNHDKRICGPVFTHPKLVLAAFGLFALIFEALTGVTVTVGNEAIDTVE